MLVNYKLLNILNIGGEFKLMPGINDVNLPEEYGDDFENVAKKYPKVQRLLDDDLIEIVDAPREPRAPAAKAQPSAAGAIPLRSSPKPASGGVTNITQFGEKDAVRLVRQTHDGDLLTNWLEIEQRPNVIKAIEDQMATLGNAGEPE